MNWTAAAHSERWIWHLDIESGKENFNELKISLISPFKIIKIRFPGTI